MTVSTKDIAHVCGVSRGTVDRALNGRGGINPQTREKILKVSNDLGYRPDFIAKSLATGKTMTLGVVVLDVYSRFFGQLVQSIETQAKQYGFFTYLTLSCKDTQMELQCIEHLVSRKVDGIILFSINKKPGFADYLGKLDVPVVTIVNRVGETLDYVGIDDCKAMMEVVEYLSQNGHMNISYIDNPSIHGKDVNSYALKERLKGFSEGCSSAGIRNSSRNVISDPDYCRLVIDLMNKPGRPTAIACSNDIYALEILNSLKANGLSVPHDVSLVGFDDIDTLKYIDPSMTTVSYPIGEMGKQAVDMLIRKINTEDAQKTSLILPHQLIIRKSVNYLP